MGLAPAPLNADSFRGALGAVAASVNVITMWTADGTPVGMTATAFSSVSTDPLLVLVCVNRSTRTYHHIADSGHFGVNVLGSTAREISDRCARPGADKLLEPEWLAPVPAASPALAGALAFLDCEIDQNVAAGTHAVLIGRVRAIGLEESPVAEPLLYFRGRYRQMDVTTRYRRASPLPIVGALE
ncbi:flavin reductase family protein [Streptomyces sp. 4N509B]|uniref:flavin reductase family protein n=1 Tax=Streptomyces sp. 4N509B TaxID=3457413 RepID=UPI003FCEF213